MITITAANWQIDNITGVLFDKDGTLIDSHLYWGRIIQRRAQAIIQYYGLSNDLFPSLTLVMGFDLSSGRLRPEGPIALVSREEVIKVVQLYLEGLEVSSKEEQIEKLFLQEHEAFMKEIHNYICLLPGVLPFLEELSGHNVKLAVVTTDSIKNTQESLEYSQIAKYFHCVVGKESVKEIKATGIPAQEAMRLLNVLAETTVCIGDAPMDLLMAQNSGCKAGIGVCTGQLQKGSLEPYSHYVVDGFNQLSITSE